MDQARMSPWEWDRCQLTRKGEELEKDVLTEVENGARAVIGGKRKDQHSLEVVSTATRWLTPEPSIPRPQEHPW